MIASRKRAGTTGAEALMPGSHGLAWAARAPVRRSRVVGWTAVLLGLLLASAVIVTPLSDMAQAWFALGGLLLYAVINRWPGRPATLLLVVISVVVSLRYITWRIIETLEYGTTLQAFLGTGLLLAEIYAVCALVLGYFQAAWPLTRKPVPLPRDPALWPTVDVFIPTFNEPLQVVKSTVYAALAMDWPREKLNVWVLDDGRRPEFRAFAEEIGAGYITRPDNKGAKAGNINNALAQTSGDYVVIFDSDHVATRGFLQLTLGWMLRDRRLAMIQTPHHFYSPDPFERNLQDGRKVPNEGLMFYGLVQPGNDLWDAPFFCGSCAVIRREALEQVGGVPTETVTEDCHCSLKMQQLGWRCAFLQLPLASGLATERLMLHVGQRMRWARGMLQILRIEKPLFARGLKWHQRICYFSATFHFLFAVPRVVFLTAPLAFLLLGQNIIAASPLAILAYAGPHILHSFLTASRIAGRVRHSFWSEVYETTLALRLVPLTLVTLFDPRKGKFNVTEKGGLVRKTYFDVRAVWPNLVLATLLLVGIAIGIHGISTAPADSLEFQAYTLNTVWAALCLVPVLAAIVVGRERRQRRVWARVKASMPVWLRLSDGRSVSGHASNLSLGGAAVSAPRPPGPIAAEELAVVALDIGTDRVEVPARLVSWEGNSLRMSFAPRTALEEGQVVRAVLGRADAWVDWDAQRPDRILRSLREVVELTLRGIVGIRGVPASRQQEAAAPDHVPEVLAPRGASPVSLAGRIAAGPMTAVLLALALSGAAVAQGLPTGMQEVQTDGAAVTEANPAGSGIEPGLPASAPTAGRRMSLSLRQLGLRGPMQLRGTSDLQGVLFGLRADEVVTEARLTLSGATSPALVPDQSQLVVTLNEQFVHAVNPDRSRPSFGPVDIPLNPLIFSDVNRLNFRFAGRYEAACNDPLSGLLWTTVSEHSMLHLTVERLPPVRDLARLPEPFFDRRVVHTPLTLPFVVAEGASDETLRGAAIAASWFAVQADFRGASFPVHRSLPTTGHAVVLAAAGEPLPDGMVMPQLEGPTLAIAPNPADPYGVLLIVAGRSGAEAATAASALAAGQAALAGRVARVTAPQLPARAPYDAPRWLPADRPVRLGEIVDLSELQSTGFAPGPVRIPFRTSPDLVTWRQRPLELDLRFRAPGAPLVDLSAARLDVSLSDIYLRSIPLAGVQGTGLLDWLERRIGLAADPRGTGRAGLPTWMLTGQNELQLRFDMRPLARGDCAGIPGDIRAGIDPDSTIDISNAHRFATLPNLAFFAGSGFPFTRLADLSETAVVMPEHPTAAELSAFLGLIGRLSAIVGLPATGLNVVRPAGLDRVADRDLIVVGTVSGQPALQRLMGDRLPVRVEGDRLAISLPDRLSEVREIFGAAPARRAEREQAAALLAQPADTLGLLIGFESPLRAGRSVVALAGATPAGIQAMASALADPEQVGVVQGDLAIAVGGRMTSYRTGPTYSTGSLPPWLWPQHFLGNEPWLLLGVLAFGSPLIAFPAYWSLRRRAAIRLRTRTRS